LSIDFVLGRKSKSGKKRKKGEKRFREFSVERRKPGDEMDASRFLKVVWKMTDVKDTGLKQVKKKKKKKKQQGEEEKKRKDFATETNESDWSTLPSLLLHHLFSLVGWFVRVLYTGLRSALTHSQVTHFFFIFYFDFFFCSVCS
jgi:hypothetical protein